MDKQKQIIMDLEKSVFKNTDDPTIDENDFDGVHFPKELKTTRISKILRWLWSLRSHRSADDTIPISLANTLQPFATLAKVNLQAIWDDESFFTKVNSILTNKWQPTEDSLMKAAISILLEDIYGHQDDFGTALLLHNMVIEMNLWDLSALREPYYNKALSLASLAISTRQRFRHIMSNPPLNLSLAKRYPEIVQLTLPMMIKVPVQSMRYFIAINTGYAFNEILASGHRYAHNILDYLYELLFIQQKTAIGLFELLRLISFTTEKKDDSVFINSEINAIIQSDVLFSCLRATIEKVTILIGYLYNIQNIEEKKKQTQKVSTLSARVGGKLNSTFYGDFVLTAIKTDSIDELDAFRNGILHKKGIAELQPHNYYGKNAKEIPLLKLYSILHNQHVKNSALLIASLALLTDELMQIEFERQQNNNE